jgi:uncharacterized protein (TIGR04255 family)
VSFSALESLKLSLPDYPKAETIHAAQAQIMLGEQIGASASSSSVGYRLTSSTGQYILQASLTGFALSRLAPYETWELFLAEARRLFAVYFEVVHPVAFVRLGVRYINKFDFPGTHVRLEDYLQIYPEVPDTLTSITGFYMRLTTELPEFEAQATISEVGVEPTQPDHVSVILDIDVFHMTETSDADEAWSKIGELREAEYRVFEASLTDKARELIS